MNKPLLELSLIEENHPQTNIGEIMYEFQKKIFFKLVFYIYFLNSYFKVLIQEFFVKLDQRIITTLIAMFTNKDTKSVEDTRINNPEEFAKDLEEIKETLRDMVYIGKKDLANLIYFHECELSPIKV